MKFLFFSLFLFTISNANIVCPNGFTLLNNNKCVKLIPNQLLHSQAELDCRYFGGTLVTVKNSIDNRAVANLAAASDISYIWIGIYCFSMTSGSVCYSDDSMDALTYQNFANGLFNPTNNQGCVVMNTKTGQWSSSMCEISGNSFICEAPVTFTDNEGCKHSYGPNCYLPSHEFSTGPRTANTTQARSICKQKNAQLVSIHSIQELDFIKSIYRKISYINSITIGAQVYSGQPRYWIDGTPWNFDYMYPWADVEWNQAYLEMNVDGNALYQSRNFWGLWYPIYDSKDNYFLCKRALSNSPALAADARAAPAATIPPTHCNERNLWPPVSICSPGYPSSQSSSCTWGMQTLGPYQVAYFMNGTTYNNVYVIDEFGQSNFFFPLSGKAMHTVVPGNIGFVSFKGSGRYGTTGFQMHVMYG